MKYVAKFLVCTCLLQDLMLLSLPAQAQQTSPENRTDDPEIHYQERPEERPEEWLTEKERAADSNKIFIEPHAVQGAPELRELHR